MQNLAEREARLSFTRRTLIPFIYAGLLILVSVAIAGSYLIEIEDHYANAILGGGYGSYEPYVANIHPLLGKAIAALYAWMPTANWFGVALLTLLFCAGAAAVSLIAHRPDRLIPGLVVLSPVLVVLVCSLQSRVVGALCVISGTLCVIDGCADGRQGIRRAVCGALLLAAGTALSVEQSWVLAALALLLSLANSRESIRRKAFWISLPIIVLSVGASTLTARIDATWREFHDRYVQYERAADSFLIDDVEDLLKNYGTVLSIDGGTVNIDTPDQGTLPTLEEATEASVLGKIGWSLNDADLFLRRSGVDAELTSPESVAKVNQYAAHFSTRGFIARLTETVKKMQFLMMIGLFLICALIVELTNRRRGLTTLFASIITLGGHAVMLLINHNSFRDIAPFYLLAILSLLTDYDAAASLAWFRKIINVKALQVIISVFAAAAFVCAMSVLLIMMRSYNNTASPSLSASQELYDAMDRLPEAVFIGDNPLDRYNPSAMDIPRFGADARLPAGSYDLYSPRQSRILEQFNIKNPIKDAVNRLDVVYVDMSGSTLVKATQRVYQAYDVIAVTAQPTVAGEPLMTPNGQHRMQLYWLQSVTQDEYEGLLRDYAASLGDHDHENDSLDHAEEEHRIIYIMGTEPRDDLLELFHQQYGYTYRTEITVDNETGASVVEYIAIEDPPPGYEAPSSLTDTPTPTSVPGPSLPTP